MPKPLRILFVCHVEAEPHLGVGKHISELADALRAQGHTVEIFDLFAAYPHCRRWRGKRRLNLLLRKLQPTFAARAAAYIRRHAAEFDVVDAISGYLPQQKQELDFNGLLVARSVGLYFHYRDFDRGASTPDPPVQTLRNRLRQWLLMPPQPTEAAHRAQFAHADLVNLINRDEAAYARDNLGLPAQKVMWQPAGISAQRLEDFRVHAGEPSARLAAKQIVFVGTWDARKGCREWPAIIRRVRAEESDARFLFLGTGAPEESVHAALDPADRESVEVRPYFHANELPALLAGVTVGAFPSHIEGFGLAVLEKLAAGLPTVAWDVPGPREMLGADADGILECGGGGWLTPCGEPEPFAGRLVETLRLSPGDYQHLSEQCRTRAHAFNWDSIAAATAEAYAGRVH